MNIEVHMLIDYLTDKVAVYYNYGGIVSPWMQQI